MGETNIRQPQVPRVARVALGVEDEQRAALADPELTDDLRVHTLLLGCNSHQAT